MEGTPRLAHGLNLTELFAFERRIVSNHPGQGTPKAELYDKYHVPKDWV
jgi:hypothetical protein